MKVTSFAVAVVGGLVAAALSPSVLATPMLEQLAPTSTSYTYATEFGPMSWSPIGDVTSHVSNVDLASTDSGCQAADFSGFATGNIALLKRGTCNFYTKAENAEAAGAVGVLIYNNVVGSDALFGTLTQYYTGSIPVFGLTLGLGETLASTSGLEVRMYNDIPPPTIPDPSTLSLLGLGVAGLAYQRIKRSRHGTL